VGQDDAAGQIELFGLALDKGDLLALYTCLGAASADANCSNSGVLNIEDDSFEPQPQCDLESDTDADPFFVYGRVVMAWSAEASLSAAVKDREER
jgi:hypothetical protein